MVIVVFEADLMGLKPISEYHFIARPHCPVLIAPSSLRRPHCAVLQGGAEAKLLTRL